MKKPFIYLAPMAGVGDTAMRIMCRSYGAMMTVTEMISSVAVRFGDRKTFSLAKITPPEGPVSIQLFGHEPETVAYAIQMLYERAEIKPVSFDINMGCPVKKIVSSGDGSALMRDLPLAERIVREAVRVSPVPVTVKMRTGFTRETKCAAELAKRCEAAGASSICVHGRTREDMYIQGTVCREDIARVKQEVGIPVYANGDVFEGKDALSLLEETGCDGVAVARGALGNPFIFEEINALLQGKEYSAPSYADRLNAARRHLCLIIEQKGEGTGVLEARKHMAWYTHGMPGAARARLKINSATTPEQCFDILDQLTEGTV